jgi:hypothetical protein
MMVTTLQVNNGRWCQETYETASKDAGKRAKQLRLLGYVVSVSALGPQVTPVGVIKLTLVDIQPGRHADTFGLPEVEKYQWN